MGHEALATVHEHKTLYPMQPCTILRVVGNNVWKFMQQQVASSAVLVADQPSQRLEPNAAASSARCVGGQASHTKQATQKSCSVWLPAPFSATQT